MTVAPALDGVRRVPAAKSRILAAATARFSSDGIRAVGVDRLIQESSVTKATFYKHYGSKERLVLEYLSTSAVDALAKLDRILDDAASPRASLFALADAVHDAVNGPTFRGSLFVNAAAEYPDPRDPARIIIADQHEAISTRFTHVLQRLAHPLPGEAADELLMAYLGAQTWGYVGDPIGASNAFRRTVERLLGDVA